MYCNHFLHMRQKSSNPSILELYTFNSFRGQDYRRYPWLYRIHWLHKLIDQHKGHSFDFNSWESSLFPHHKTSKFLNYYKQDNLLFGIISIAHFQKQISSSGHYNMCMCLLHIVSNFQLSMVWINRLGIYLCYYHEQLINFCHPDWFFVQ